MAQAGRLQAVDPTAADELWAQAERRIVDQAPARRRVQPALHHRRLRARGQLPGQRQPALRRAARPDLGPVAAYPAPDQREAGQRVRRCEPTGPQPGAHEQHRARRAAGERQADSADPLTRPALREAGDDRRRSIRRRSGAAPRPGPRARAPARRRPCAGARARRWRAAGSRPCPRRSRTPSSRSGAPPASHAPISAAHQSCACPPNGTSTGPPAAPRGRRAGQSATSQTALARMVPSSGPRSPVRRTLLRQVDEQRRYVLLGDEAHDVRAAVGAR